MTAPPASVLIGTVRYRITRDKGEWLAEDRHPGLVGLSDNTRALILLDPNTPDDVQRVTLLHEVMHCIAEDLMGGPKWNLRGGATKREETLIRMWEGPLLLVLRSNPDLITYLTAEDRIDE